MKRTTLLLFIVLSMLVTMSLHAQSGAARGKGRLHGTITDQNEKPLADVKVHFNSDDLRTSFDLRTNEKGDWVASGIAGGNWNIDFELEGYKTKRISYSITELSYNKPIQLVLEKAAPEQSKNEVKGLSLVQEAEQLTIQKDYAGAIQKYQAAIQENPSLVRLNERIGKLYILSGQTEEAINFYSKLIQSDPNNGDARVALATLLLQKKDVEKAKAVLASLDPKTVTDASPVYNLGASLYNLNQTEEAIKYFQLAANTDPAMTDAHLQLGVAYLSSGQSQKARAEFQKVIDLSANSENAKLARQMMATIQN